MQTNKQKYSAAKALLRANKQTVRHVYYNTHARSNTLKVVWKQTANAEECAVLATLRTALHAQLAALATSVGKQHNFTTRTLYTTADATRYLFTLHTAKQRAKTTDSNVQAAQQVIKEMFGKGGTFARC